MHCQNMNAIGSLPFYQTVQYQTEAGSIVEGLSIYGILHGPAKEQFPDGTILHCEFVNGIRHGKALEIFPDGSEIYCNYKLGEREGEAKLHQGGSTIVFHYNRGIGQGPATEHCSDGTRIDFVLVDGCKQGEAQKRLSNGQIIKFQYSNGYPCFASLLNNLNQAPISDYRNEARFLPTPNGSRIHAIHVNGIPKGPALEMFEDMSACEFEYDERGVRTGPALDTLLDMEESRTIEFKYCDNFGKGYSIEKLGDHSIEFTYNKDVRTGFALEKIENKTIQFQYFNGIRWGEACEIEGNRVTKFYYVNGEKDGYAFDIIGDDITHFHYKNGKRNGLALTMNKVAVTAYCYFDNEIKGDIHTEVMSEHNPAHPEVKSVTYKELNARYRVNVKYQSGHVNSFLTQRTT